MNCLRKLSVVPHVKIEHAIGEYTSGTHVQVPFKESKAKSSYVNEFIVRFDWYSHSLPSSLNYHKKNWDKVADISKDWSEFYLTALLGAIA